MSENKLPLAERLKKVRNVRYRLKDLVSRIEEEGIVTTKISFQNTVSATSGVSLEAAENNGSLLSAIRNILSKSVMVLNPAYVFAADYKSGKMDGLTVERISILAEEADILSDIWEENKEMELMTILERLIQAYVKSRKNIRGRNVNDWVEQTDEI
ncbi:MAG: hypothetical protein IJ873_02965 [Lachnospiraceae bacterium]|nr:hypothetical protein [Lachnospiraceae bacterium]